MKKVIFALAAVVALAACSKEQTVNVPQGAAIGFDTFVENSTRVAESADPSLTVDALKGDDDGFGVYGFVTNGNVTAPIFTNEQVKWTDGAWRYDDTQYWIDGATYDFAAIAPFGAYTVTEAATDGVTLSFLNNGTTDLLYAQNNGVDGSDHPQVGFTFKHLLSKVKFTFTNGYDATNTLIAVKNIVIENTYANGDAELGRNNDGVTAVWNVENADATLNLEFGDAVTNGYIAQNASEQSAKSLLIIPANKTYKVTFTVELYYMNGDAYTLFATYDHEVDLAANFEFGKSYNVATTISYKNIDPDVDKQYPIEFTVTAIEDWENGNTADADDPADGENDHYPLN